MKTLGAILTLVFAFAISGVANAGPYGSEYPGVPGSAKFQIPYKTTCDDTREGALCQDSDADKLGVGNGSTIDYYYPFGTVTDGKLCIYSSSPGKIICNTDTVTDTNTNASTECTGTGTYYDGEGNCDNTTNFVITCTGGQTLGTDCGSGYDFTIGFIVEIASGTLTLPAVALGYHGCIKATTAAAITIDPNASDRIRLDMLAGSDGEYILSDGTLDSTICLYADSTAGWTSLFNPHGFTAE